MGGEHGDIDDPQRRSRGAQATARPPAHNGRSTEAEIREILKGAVGGEGTAKPDAEENLADAIRRIFEPLGGVELELPPRGPGREPPKFDE